MGTSAITSPPNEKHELKYVFAYYLRTVFSNSMVLAKVIHEVTQSKDLNLYGYIHLQFEVTELST